ncbi:hypothetical protein M011DRAFT_468057 [Sporormia fimetaria CBS 119925]|uniref:RNA ligase/cyclic nucleotide phosphodiesterase n=1 Tax=Sporormia fimetaria CBS 119925 TaxID=1340428 RepID=A0A6A6VC70_9PLEO|nr:hypothetical protein M011DRAFT_468057 [Sporormia fimetaria CBS 119925]
MYEDHSGVSTNKFSNPYDALISACNNDPSEIQARYNAHRTTRNAQQKTQLLSPAFKGVNIDPILLRLTDPAIEPGYADPRHCLVFWARPPQHLKDLILKIQKELQTVAPNLWLMPPTSLHMTTLEVTHSRTSPEIATLLSTLQPSLKRICDYPSTHPTRLTKPLISFDASALALSFVPEALPSEAHDGVQTYHHLRRSIYNLCTEASIPVDSRYVVPSAHLTIARFISANDFQGEDGGHDGVKMAAFIQKIEELNQWLQDNYWPSDETEAKSNGEWIVGADKGLDCRKGTLWYGGGETVYLGKGHDVARN